MNIVRIIVAIILGLVIGGAVNMGLIMLGSSIIPAPDGVDVQDVDSIAGAMHLFQPKHFLFPFLAHAGGTLVGALAGHLIAGTHRNVVAYIIGAAFFAGGIAAATMIPAPTWFTIGDLVLSYFPMALIATIIGTRIRAIEADA
jgi:hypothetical protein